MKRIAPPRPLLAVIVVLIVLGVLLGLRGFAAFAFGSGTLRDRLSAFLGFLVLSLLTLWTARMVFAGQRGGRALASIIAVVVVIAGLLMATWGSPWPVIAVVPVFTGAAMLLCLFAFFESREWFRPELWDGWLL